MHVAHELIISFRRITYVRCITCCSEHIEVHVALHVVMCKSKKNDEMNATEYLQRATFTSKKEVGGRELTKLWV